MYVSEIMTTPALTVGPNAEAKEVADALRRSDAGSVVVEADGPLGIVTEADLAILVAEEGNIEETTAADLMTTDPVTVDGYEDVEEAARLMKKKGIRNLPVVHDGAFVGILTSTDVTYRLSEIMTGERMDKDKVRELLEEAR